MAPLKCPDCGSAVAAETAACPACGNPVAATPDAAAREMSLAAKAQQFLLVQLCCLGAVFIFAGNGAGVWGVVIFLAAVFGFPLARLAAPRRRQ